MCIGVRDGGEGKEGQGEGEEGEGEGTYTAGWDVFGYSHALRGVGGAELGGWDGGGSVCNGGALGGCVGEEGEAESQKDGCWLHGFSG